MERRTLILVLVAVVGLIAVAFQWAASQRSTPQRPPSTQPTDQVELQQAVYAESAQREAAFEAERARQWEGERMAARERERAAPPAKRDVSYGELLARRFYERLAQVRDPRSKLARALDAIDRRITKHLREASSDQAAFLLALKWVGANDGATAMLMALNLFGRLGPLALEIDDEVRSRLGELTPEMVANVPNPHPDVQNLELDWLTLERGYLGARFVGVARVLTEEASFITVRFEVRDADGVIVASASATRFEPTRAGDAFKFEAPAFEAFPPGGSFRMSFE